MVEIGRDLSYKYNFIKCDIEILRNFEKNLAIYVSFLSYRLQNLKIFLLFICVLMVIHMLDD